MSVLETFVLLFKADTDDLKKGSTDAKKTTEDLNRSLENTSSVSNKLGNSFNSMIKQAAGVLTAVASVGAVIGGLKYAARFADEIGKLSEAVGIDTESISAWGDAVKLSGGTAEGFQNTVRSLTASLADFATKGTSRAAPFFQELGIKMVDAKGKARNFIDILPELAKSFEKLSKAESFGIGQKLGLDQGTIILLQKGQKEVDTFVARQKELGVVTKKDAEIAAKFNDQLDDTLHAFRSLALGANSELLPVLTALVKMFEDLAVYLRKNPEIIKAVGIALGGLLAFFAPVAAGILAVSAAIVLLYDDFMHFKKGNDSLIGEMLKRWPYLGPIFETIGAIIKSTFNAAINIITFVLVLFEKLFDSIGVILDAFHSLGDAVKIIWDAILMAIEKAVNGVLYAFDKVIGAYNKVKGFLGLGDSSTASDVEVTKNLITQASEAPINSRSLTSIANTSKALTRNTSVQVGTVTIETQANDAEGIAAAFNQSLETQIRQAVANFDDGVVA